MPSRSNSIKLFLLFTSFFPQRFQYNKPEVYFDKEIVSPNRN